MWISNGWLGTIIISFIASAQAFALDCIGEPIEYVVSEKLLSGVSVEVYEGTVTMTPAFAPDMPSTVHGVGKASIVGRNLITGDVGETSFVTRQICIGGWCGDGSDISSVAVLVFDGEIVFGPCSSPIYPSISPAQRIKLKALFGVFDDDMSD